MAYVKSIRGQTNDAQPTLGRPRKNKTSDYRQLLRRKSDKRIIKAQLEDAWNKLEDIRDEFRHYFFLSLMELETSPGTTSRDLESLQKDHDRLLGDYVALLESYLANYKLDPEDDYFVFLRIGHIEQSDVVFQKLGLSDDFDTREEVIRLLIVSAQNQFRIYSRAPTEDNLVDLFLCLSELNGYSNKSAEEMAVSDEVEAIIRKALTIVEDALEGKKKELAKYLVTGVRPGDSRLMRESAKVVNRKERNDPVRRMMVNKRMLGLR